jgi:hypothetical protein
MLRMVITGGQTGAEQAAWAAARRAGIATGGYMPREFVTEDGPAPRLAATYGAVEFPLDDARRTRANVRRADAVLWLGDPDSPEGRSTLAACRDLGKPSLIARPVATPPADVATWLIVFEVGVLMVAGDLASRAPDLNRLAREFLDRVFARLRHEPPQGARS